MPIVKLDENTINRIAAGEVIHRPVNAVKEMLENAIDAGATQVAVHIQQGGLKSIQITDNGCGISKEDLPLLCQRFATSKLASFDDLKSVETFGFRGEALASISHVASLAVVTKTSDQPCAYRAEYADGKMLPGFPRPCAGVNGTQFTITDMFNSSATRKGAMNSASEEYRRILDMMSKYALNYSGVALTCRKNNDRQADLLTTTSASKLDNIRLLHGPQLAKEVMEVTVDHEEQYHCQTSIWASTLHHKLKKTMFILFINNRLVECAPLRKAIEAIYAQHMPKSDHPFIFANLKLPPSCLDVNVHPQKREVRFLYEDEIITEIQTAVEEALEKTAASKSFHTQTTLTSDLKVSTKPSEPTATNEKGKRNRGEDELPPTARPYKYVRTDPRLQAGQLEKYLCDTGAGKASGTDVPSTARAKAASGSLRPKAVAGLSPDEELHELTSIRTLFSRIVEESHSGLQEIFAKYTYVGWIGGDYALVQFQTGLYLLNMQQLSRQFLYERVLLRFGRPVGRIELTEPLSIRDALAEAVQELPVSERPADVEHSVAQWAMALMEKSEMLLEYYGIEIDVTGGAEVLKSLPVILPDHVPPVSVTHRFLHRLCTAVDYRFEERCLQQIAQELATFYAVRDLRYRHELEQKADEDVAEPSPAMDGDDVDEYGNVSVNSISLSSLMRSPRSEAATQDADEERAGYEGTNVKDKFSLLSDESVRYCIQRVMLPAMRSLNFRVPRKFGADGTVVEVACLEKLYRVFERC